MTTNSLPLTGVNDHPFDTRDLDVAQDNLFHIARKVGQQQVEKGGSGHLLMGELLRACVALYKAGQQ